MPRQISKLWYIFPSQIGILYSTNNFNTISILLLPNPGSKLLTTQKPMIWEASVSIKEKCFNQKNWLSGEIVDSCARDQLQSLLSHDSFKRKRGSDGKNLSESLLRRFGFCLILYCLQTSWLLLQILSCPNDLPAGLLRGTFETES